MFSFNLNAISDRPCRVFAPCFAACPMNALLFWAMFFLIIAYGPSSLPGLQALHAV